MKQGRFYILRFIDLITFYVNQKFLGYCFIDFDTHQEAKFFMEMYNGAPIPNSKK
jgi:hypothetical protein